MAEPIDETSDTWAILDEAFPTLREQDLGYVVQDYTVKSPNSTGRIAKKRLFVTVVAEAPADLATAQARLSAIAGPTLEIDRETGDPDAVRCTWYTGSRWRYLTLGIGPVRWSGVRLWVGAKQVGPRVHFFVRGRANLGGFGSEGRRRPDLERRVEEARAALTAELTTAPPS